MNQAQALHREAMAFANETFSAQRQSDFPQYLALSRKAFEKGKEAAWLLFDQFKTEPARSVLFRSAAQWAFNCGLIREAEQLIAAALIGNPPAGVMAELRQLSIVVLSSLEEATA